MFKFLPFMIIFLSISLVSLGCYQILPWFGYHSVGFILLFCILAISTKYQLVPTLFSAFLSALIWNYYFIPPKFTFSIRETEDLMMLATFFAVAIFCGSYSSIVKKQKKDIEREKVKFLSQQNESLILRESEKLHQALLNSLSHELRVPLTSIIGSTSAIIEKNILQDKLKVLLIDVLDSAKKLSEIIENLLDISRISSGVLKIKQDLFELNDFIKNFLEKNHYSKVQVTFEDTSDVYVTGDEILIENAFSNLIRNALIHSGENPRVTIQLIREEEFVQVCIRDYGSGVNVEDQEKLWLPFYRHSSYGLGLGLAISKSILEAHGGTINITNCDNPSGFKVQLRFKLADVKNLESML